MVLPRRNKYSAQRTTLDGISFDSKKEARRWAELCLLQKAGEIADLRRQVPITLEGRQGPLLTRTGRRMKYVADFVYFNVKANCETIEDAKGHRTKDYNIKRAIVEAMGLDILET